MTNEFNSIQELIEQRAWKAGMGMSGFDSSRNYSGPDRSEWVVGFGQSRDSDILQRANFHALLDALGGESDGSVEVARFGHWACGWVEQIHVHVTATDKLQILMDCINAVADYPVLDEDIYSEMEMEERNETFENYKSDFAKELADWLEYEDLEGFKQSEIDEILWAIYSEDCAYSGQEDGWVDPEAISRAFGRYSDVKHQIERRYGNRAPRNKLWNAMKRKAKARAAA